jgi:4-amino-4-deoxy-L-arabinose transferase-like glycosyltransferase
MTTSRVPDWLAWGGVALALLLLVNNLGGAFALFMRGPLNPDVTGFLAEARGMRLFYDCPSREPFHVAWLKPGLLLSDDGEAVARLTTMVQTVLTALALYLFGARFFGRPSALCALLLFCVNPVVRFYGVSGLRDPLFAGMMLVFALLLFDPLAPRETGGPEGPDGMRSRLRALLAGIAGACMVLTRVYGYAVLAGAFALFAMRERVWDGERRRAVLRHLGRVAAAAALLLIPDLLFRPASPVHAQTVNLFRNVELHGEPGTWQSDPPVGHFQYLFGEHTLQEIGARVVRNYARYARQYLPHYLRGYEALWVLLPLGMVAALATGRGFVAGLLLLSIAPVVFVLHLNQVPGVRGIENRFVFQAFPFALLLMAHGALWILNGLRPILTGRRFRGTLRHSRRPSMTRDAPG